MEFAIGQDEEELFPHRLGFLALRAKQLAGRESAELIHDKGSVAMMRNISRKTFTGEAVELTILTSSGP